METLVLREERPSFNYLNDFGGFWKPGPQVSVAETKLQTSPFALQSKDVHALRHDVKSVVLFSRSSLLGYLLFFDRALCILAGSDAICSFTYYTIFDDVVSRIRNRSPQELLRDCV